MGDSPQTPCFRDLLHDRDLSPPTLKSVAIPSYIATYSESCILEYRGRLISYRKCVAIAIAIYSYTKKKLKMPSNIMLCEWNLNLMEW